MHKKVEDTINTLIQAFGEKFDDFHGLYLYGLFADGEFHKGEDMELVAIFDIENKFKREAIWPIIGKIETDLGVCIDLYPMTMEDLEKDEDFFDEVVHQGIFFKV